MLKFLYIKDFALASDLRIEFSEGLNILTGETGAGKSILVGAIAAVLGGRVFTEVVRTGAEQALVEAIFDIQHLPAVKNLLKEKGIEAGDELFLRREISSKGSTRAFVNDVAVTISTLSEIGNFLVDIHGQHEHQSLLKKDIHRYFLDAYGQLQPLLESVSEAYTRLISAREKLENLARRQKELDEKYDLFLFQVEEIEKARLKPGEDEELERERRLLANSEKLFEISTQLQQIFQEGEVNLLDQMGQVSHLLRELSPYSEELEKLYQEFASAKIVVEETARSIEEFQSQLEFDPLRLEEIEARLDTIARLKKKYGATIEEIFQYYEKIKAELDLRENFDFELGKLQKEYQLLLEDYRARVLELSERRKTVARQMEEAVQEKLNELGMPGTKFRVHIEWEENPEGLFQHENRYFTANELGVDQVEFYISPNPGEDFKPLSKIASGGEISRIMLALKSILAEIDRVPTLIFDEIDIGISGRVAQAVGKSIANLSRSHQILCITHLPQIASQGKHHFTVKKYVQDGRTFTAVERLSPEERVEEIARLIGGKKVSDSARESARQLIAEGNE